MGIRIENLSYSYSKGTTFARQAIKNINLNIEDGEFVGLIGHTGSGKSTLLQHFNGLLKGESGTIYFDGKDINEKKFNRKELHFNVGLVFQYPEYQFFETTVLKDVSFGPKNMGLSEEEAIKVSKEALESVGIGEDCYEKSPFELSGGQKRRVAIAGILAMKPRFLILDEPAAGLDPEGRTDILSKIREYHEKEGTGVVLVSHNMDDIAEYADRIVVMNDGEIVMDDTPVKVFNRYEELEAIGLSAPSIKYILLDLKKKGLQVDTEILDIKKAALNIKAALDKR